MAFNKINLLSIEDAPVSQVHIFYVENSSTTGATDSNDIFYHLGTNLGQSVWSNPAQGPNLTITESQVTGNSLESLTDRNNTSSFSVSGTNITLPFIITFELENGFEIDLQAFRYYYRNSNSYAWDTFKWEGSNNGTDWELLFDARSLDIENGTDDTWYYEPMRDNRPGFFSKIRLNIPQFDTSNIFNAGSVELYGRLRNLTTGVAGYKTPGDRFDSLLNVDALNPRLNREIVYDAQDGLWESRVNQVWKVDTQVMTSDLSLTREDLRNPTFYVLSPNGATRNVYLPVPEKDDAIKFRNLDGLHTINIYEEGGGTPVVLNNGGKLQYEYVYDGIEWHVIG